MEENRSGERTRILGELQGEIMVFQPLRVTEISHGGASVDTRFPLQLDSLHDLRLTLGADSVVVKARVVHSRISDVDQDIVTYRSGMEFIGVPDRVAAAIAAFLDAVRASRGGR
jgi:hypothetical protein